MRAYAIGELMTEEDSLAHYGVRGMKWGVRRGSSKTGVSRGRGAVIDRNNRDIKDFKQLKEGLAGKGGGKNGGGTRTTRAINFTNRMTMGKKMTAAYYDTNISNLTAQNKRLQSGKATLLDKATVLASAYVTPLALVVSVRPKD